MAMLPFARPGWPILYTSSSAAGKQSICGVGARYYHHCSQTCLHTDETTGQFRQTYTKLLIIFDGSSRSRALSRHKYAGLHVTFQGMRSPC